MAKQVACTPGMIREQTHNNAVTMRARAKVKIKRHRIGSRRFALPPCSPLSALKTNGAAERIPRYRAKPLDKWALFESVVARFVVEVFAFVHGPKGCGETCAALGPSLIRTNEYQVQQTLKLDVGQMIGGRPQHFSVWGGYRRWKNKFGISPDQPVGPFQFTLESTWLAGATWAF